MADPMKRFGVTFPEVIPSAVIKPDPERDRRVVRLVTRKALDADDCAELLAMLGLNSQPDPEPLTGTEMDSTADRVAINQPAVSTSGRMSEQHQGESEHQPSTATPGQPANAAHPHSV